MKNNQVNWFPVPHSVLEDSEFISMPLSARMFLIHLFKLRNRFGDVFFHDVKSLMKETGLSDRCIHRSKKLLSKWIEIVKGFNKETGHRKVDVFKFKLT